MVNDQLYILPHEGWRDIVRGRVEAILEGGEPVEIDFQDMIATPSTG